MCSSFAAFGEISDNLIIISPQHMLNRVEKTGLLQMGTENTVDIAFAKIPPSLLFVIFFKENTMLYVCLL